MKQQEANRSNQQDPPRLYSPLSGPEPSAFHRPGSNLFSEQAWAEIARTLRISPKELAIARKVFDGCTEFAIAMDLCMSCHTAHTHIKRLHRRLGAIDRVGLVVRLTQQFLYLTASPDNTLPPICASQGLGVCPFANGLSA